MQIKDLCVILLVFFLISCQSQPDFTSHEKPAIPVIAHPPTIKDLTFNIESIGTLQAASFVEIRPQVNGILKKTLVQEGEIVGLGTPLFEIDNNLYTIQVQEANAQATSDQITKNALEKKLLRYKQLVEKDLLSQTEWDDIEASKEKAGAALLLSQARLAVAKLNLSYCTIYSPIDGKIGKISIHPGNHLSFNQPQTLTTITNLNTLIAEFYVTEKEFSKISKDSQLLEISSISHLNERKNATLSFIDHSFDQKTGLIAIHAKIDNKEGKFSPGQTVRVFLPIKFKTQVLLIPQKAIRYNQDGPFVYIIQSDNTVKKSIVVLGKEYESDQIIKQGIVSTDLVVHDGHLRLVEGSKVDVVK